MDRVRVGLIGYGRRLRGVARNVCGQSERIEVTAVCDIAEESIAEARKEFGDDIPIYTEAESLVAEAPVDWVMIGSPNHLHAGHSIAAFNAGKHVFCEKPLATTAEDCAAMIEASERTGCTFTIGFTLRYSPHYQRIRELIESGQIGSVVSMEFNESIGFSHGGHIHSHPWRRKTALGGSHMLEKCCHDLDLANWLVGSVPAWVGSFGGVSVFIPENAYLKDVVAETDGEKGGFTCWSATGERVDPFTTTDKDVVDNQVAILEYANAVRATFHTNCCAGIPERRMYACGTEGAIRADVIKGEIEMQKIGLTTKPERVEANASGGHGGGDAVLAKSVASTMLEGTAPQATLRDGLLSAVTAFAMNEAMERKAIVPLQPWLEKVGAAG